MYILFNCVISIGICHFEWCDSSQNFDSARHNLTFDMTKKVLRGDAKIRIMATVISVSDVALCQLYRSKLSVKCALKQFKFCKYDANNNFQVLIKKDYYLNQVYDVKIQYIDSE